MTQARDAHKFFFDTQIMNSVIELVESSQEQLILVSPYNDFSVHLRNAVEQAYNRSVRVIAVCRSEQEQKEKQHLDRLTDLGAEVYLVERLHGKLYLNESQAIITSMNLVKGSAMDSSEIAVRLQDTEEIRKYVCEKLISNADSYHRQGRSSSKPEAESRPTTLDRPNGAGLLAIAGEVVNAFIRGGEQSQAYCIRSSDHRISFDPERPMCDDCYKTWSRFKNEDYLEGYCHRCGQERKTSYGKPLCRSCYRSEQPLKA